MKSKVVKALLAVVFCACLCVGVAACGDSNEQGGQTEIEKVYAQYVIHAEAEGEKPLSYEEWLAAIKGEKGDKGDQGEKGETGAQGPQGEKGEDGQDGANGSDGKDGVDGKSAYQIWLDNGNVGTQADFLNWLKGQKGEDGNDGVNGKSAYELYCEAYPEYDGTLEEWLDSLKGENGVDGSDGKDGQDGSDGKDGEDGVNGKSAYELYCEAYPEYDGTLEEWLAGLKGEDGVDGSDGKDGQDGSDGKDGEDGVNGKSAYELYCEAYPEYDGTLEEWLAGLKGEDGVDGSDGKDGQDGSDGIDGKSAYQIWLDAGNEGTEEDFLAWLKGLNDHTYGEWVELHLEPDAYCNEMLFYRTCTVCGKLEWKQGSEDDHVWETVTTDPTCQAGGYDTKTCTTCGKIERENYTDIADHAWGEEYTYDNSYHWYACATCGETKDKAEHTADETGACTVCNALVGPTTGVVYDLSADGTYAEVIGYEGTATRVRIADTYEGAPVTGIYNNAFEGKSIYSAVIPDSVTMIGNRAFSASRLMSVEIGDGVISIGEYAFQNCTSLASVVIPDSVVTIENCAFQFCINLTSVVIGNGVTSIGSSAFSRCDNLTFSEYEKCKYLGNESNPYFAFIETTSDNYNNYTIHENTKIIAGDAFAGCSRMASIAIPDSVTSIGAYAFEDCTSLTSVVIGDSVTSIGDNAFSGCTGLTSATLPAFVVSYMIKTNLQSVVITSGEELEESAFSNRSSLISVVLPDSLKTIGSSAFYNCTNLRRVEMGEGVTSIGNSAFSKCSSLAGIVIPDGVTEIGNYVFEDCVSLASVEIGNGVTAIGIRAFYGCSGLTSVVIPDRVTTIDNLAFSSCEGLTSIVLGNGVTTINSSAFRGCSALTGVVIPDSVVTIEGTVFAECSALTSVVLGSGVISIGGNAFMSCTSLDSVYYKGIEGEWAGIEMDGSYNLELTFATRYYYAENEADVSMDGGNYWHYDENGEIAVW